MKKSVLIKLLGAIPDNAEIAIQLGREAGHLSDRLSLVEVRATKPDRNGRRWVAKRARRTVYVFDEVR